MSEENATKTTDNFAANGGCSPVPCSPFDGELVAHQSMPLTQPLFCGFYRYQGQVEWYGNTPAKTKQEAVEGLGWAIESGCEFRIYEIHLPTNPFEAND